MKRGFLESTFVGFARIVARAMISEETARQPGLLQALDPRVRVVGLFSLVLAVTLSKKISVVAGSSCSQLQLGFCPRSASSCWPNACGWSFWASPR